MKLRKTGYLFKIEHKKESVMIWQKLLLLNHFYDNGIQLQV